MPGRFAETVGLDDSFKKNFLGRIPTLVRQGSDAGQARPGGYAGQECGALGVGRARTHWASQYSLGEPVLIGRTRIGRAIKRGWGEPSNEVGRASTKGPLGEPLNFHSGLHACFKAAPAWRGACLAHLQVPARHVYLSAEQALQVPARHVRCLPTSARSARLLTSARSAPCLQAPALSRSFLSKKR